jgi:asparagine synthase (glutamine-hydrolysing)
MCGIAGIIQSQNSNFDIRKVRSDLLDNIAHRGPDSLGSWSSNNGSVWLGHTRLSILDLSLNGAQPLVSSSGRFVITYNGEVYNFKQLKKQLLSLGYQFKSDSDTEVLLNSIEAWGLESAILKLNGMFGFAVYDRDEDELYLVRDRVGVKPLYYYIAKNIFVFASEITALKKSLPIKFSLNRKAINDYTSYGYIRDNNSIYCEIKKLLPGHLLRFKISNLESIDIKKYWDLDSISRNSQIDSNKSIDDYIEEANFLVQDSINLRMVSDVPVGAFLSGGIDSTLVTSVMQKVSNSQVKTFTIGFEESKFDESKYANDIALFLNTDHTCAKINKQDVLNLIPKLHDVFGEPFADSSAIPTLLLSKITRSKVTVSLSGDGGDELFCGYQRYFGCNNVWSLINALPYSIKINLHRILTSKASDKYRKLVVTLARITKLPGYNYLNDYSLSKIISSLKFHNPMELYDLATKQWSTSPLLDEYQENQNQIQSNNPNFFDKMLLIDQLTYLPDDILTKVDRASMHYGLESREPLLDYRLIEFSWRIPEYLKYSSGSKYLLKQILNKYIPKHFYERPKMGFGAPIGEWLNTFLNSWANDLLSKESIQKTGLYNFNTINSVWNEHQNKKRDWSYQIWNILMMQAWAKEYYK